MHRVYPFEGANSILEEVFQQPGMKLIDYDSLYNFSMDPSLGYNNQENDGQLANSFYNNYPQSYSHPQERSEQKYSSSTSSSLFYYDQLKEFFSSPTKDKKSTQAPVESSFFQFGHFGSTLTSQIASPVKQTQPQQPSHTSFHHSANEFFPHMFSPKRLSFNPTSGYDKGHLQHTVPAIQFDLDENDRGVNSNSDSFGNAYLTPYIHLSDLHSFNPLVESDHETKQGNSDSENGEDQQILQKQQEASKALLEKAEKAKKDNHIKEASAYFKQAIREYPYGWQAWIEYAKMEEEYGKLSKCQDILACGLLFCPLNESLLIKAMKLEEKTGNLTGARTLLARLRNVAPEKAWRIILEGAELEARAGEFSIARKIYKYLMKNVPNYGNVFQEACLLEERCGHLQKAITIAEKGLLENPKYGPLYLTLIRLEEKIAYGTKDLTATRAAIQRAVKNIPKELRWKFYLEEAQVEERANNLAMSRKAYVKSVHHCPNNLLWKVWMTGAKTELRFNADALKGHDESSVARKLIQRGLQEVPQKKKSQVLLEWSRLEEFSFNVQTARNILKRARKETKHEWKIFLETVLLEIRSKNVDSAIEEAEEALKTHTGTGRIWQILIALKQKEGDEEQMKVFKEAIQEVPKSGEVWCEGARIQLKKKNWTEARKFLEFSIFFTPQYGDSFIEYLRLELLEHGEKADLSKLERMCTNAEPNYGTLWLYCKKNPLGSTREVFSTAKDLLWKQIESGDEEGLLSLDCVKQHDISKMTDDERWTHIFGLQ